MKNLKLVLGAQLMLVVLVLLESSFQAVATNNQQQDLQDMKLDDIELSNQPSVPKSQKVLDSLAAAVFDEWVTEGRNKKSKERSYRQMKPTLRFGRRSDPSWAPVENSKLGLNEKDQDKFYNLI